MEESNGIRIRIASPLKFIDDDEESDDESQGESLTVVRRKKTPRDESKALAQCSRTKDMRIEVAEEKKRRKPMELTIMGENTVISIKTIGQDKYQKKEENSERELYEMIEHKVKEIFQAPNKAEIEKALEAVSELEISKGRKLMKKGIWQTLLSSVKASVKDQEERYPSIVLLQDPSEDGPPQDQYPKITFNDIETSRTCMERPKLEYRSQSMLALPTDWGRSRCTVLNEIALQKHAIALERSYLAKEVQSLAEERECLEKSKSRLSREKKGIERGKSFLSQDRQILLEKKHILKEERASLDGHPEIEANLLKKEKLCLDMEKQLLEDERRIIGEEQSVIKKEKEIMEKERHILGGEKSAIEEEKAIIGKEKVVMEKQNAFADDVEMSGESMVSCDEDVRAIDSEISEVFQETLQLSQEGCRGRCSVHQKLSLSSRCAAVNPATCWTSNCPVYVPVYNLPYRPYQQSPSCRACTRPTFSARKAQSIQTQTEQGPCSSDEQDVFRPLGLLSGLFPRVLITSMNTFPSHSKEDIEEQSSQVQELSAEDLKIPPPLPSTPIPGLTSHAPLKNNHTKTSKKSNTGYKPKPKSTKKTTATMKSSSSKIFPLQITTTTVSTTYISSPPVTTMVPIAQPPPTSTLLPPKQDLTLKAATKLKTGDSLEEPETEESGFFTFQSEFQGREDFCVSDETISVENIYFGPPDDFYSNDSLVRKKWKEEEEKEDDMETTRMDMPLTQTGKSLIARLSEYKPSEASESKSDCDLQVTMGVGEARVQLTVPKSFSINVNDRGTSQNTTISAIEAPVEPKSETEVTKKSRLWYSEDETSKQKTKNSGTRAPNIELSLPNNQNSTIHVSKNGEISVQFGWPPKEDHSACCKNVCYHCKPEPPVCHHDCYQRPYHKQSADTMHSNEERPIPTHLWRCDTKSPCNTAGPTLFPVSERQPSGSGDLSPRTATLLQALREKLELAQSGRNVMNFEKASAEHCETTEPTGLADKQFMHSNKAAAEPWDMQQPNCHRGMNFWKAAPGCWDKNPPVEEGFVNLSKACPGFNGDNLPTGLYYVKKLANPPFSQKRALEIPPTDASPREYFCEECLATMRLYELPTNSVQKMINKFENIKSQNT